MITKSTVNMIFNFRKIQPSENALVSIFAMGEGWHNYHHTFPWDYKAAELGNYTPNATTFLLDMFAKIGWAYDLKSPSKKLIQQTIENNGDGTHCR
jgi:stearoyl-CoA desaturase (delta-9 desaturase)